LITLPRLRRNDLADYRAIAAAKSTDVRRRLRKLEKTILAGYRAYYASADNLGMLRSVIHSQTAKNDLTSSYRGMRIREELLSQFPLYKCPMCGLSEPRTLDHYLPKSKFPEFSVLAVNLIPVCYECNNRKGNRVSQKPESQFLHAIFHRVPKMTPLLIAVVQFGKEARIDFHIDSNAAMPKELIARVRYQFDKLDLENRFRKEASNILAVEIYHLARHFPFPRTPKAVAAVRLC